MFGKRSNKNSLEVPDVVNSDPEAIEILRMWASPGEPQTVTLRVIHEDPGAWGLALVDIARHVAQAYQQHGREPGETLSRIKELFDAEWQEPTTGLTVLQD